MPVGRTGARIEWIADDSPAADAGVEVGDVIVMVDHARLSGAAELGDRLEHGTPGTRMWLTIERESTTLEVEVVLVSER